MSFARSAIASAVVGAAAILTGGCTKTTLTFHNVAPGHEILLNVKSSRPPLVLVNYGPGELRVTADGEGEPADWSGPAGVGTHKVPLRGWTHITIANPPEAPGPVALRIEIKDPAKFAIDGRDVPQDD